jgi:hypothetical protein
MCDYSASLDMGKGTAHIQKTLKNLIENARNSSDPESQLGMLKEALHDLYNSGDPYGDFIDVYFPLGDALLLFNITPFSSFFVGFFKYYSFYYTSSRFLIVSSFIFSYLSFW